MWELPMIEALTEELSRVILVQHEEDKVLWKSALIGVYLVKVGYQFVSFNFSHAENLFYKHLWKLFVSKNVMWFLCGGFH